MGAYKNKQAVKSLLLTGVVLVVGVVVYMSWIAGILISTRIWRIHI